MAALFFLSFDAFECDLGLQLLQRLQLPSGPGPRSPIRPSLGPQFGDSKMETLPAQKQPEVAIISHDRGVPNSISPESRQYTQKAVTPTVVNSHIAPTGGSALLLARDFSGAGLLLLIWASPLKFRVLRSYDVQYSDGPNQLNPCPSWLVQED
jgi:hypothetical protein